MKRFRLIKTIVGAVLLCTTVMTASCGDASEKEGESTVDTTNTIQTNESETSAPVVEAPGVAFEALVEEMRPVAAWSCDGEAEGSTTVKEMISGKTGTLTDCVLTDGYDGKGIRTYSNRKSYLDLGEGTLGRLIDGKEAISVSMRVLPYLNTNETYRLFTLQVNGTSAGVHAYYKNGSIEVGARCSSSGSFVSKIFTYKLDDGTVASLSEYTNEGRWQHLVFVVDFKNNNISLFINGNRLYSTDTVTFKGDSFDLGNPSECDAFGGASGRRVYSFNGVIDSMMVFDRALKTADVEKLYGERCTGTSPVTDQKWIDSIVERLGKNVVFCVGKNELISEGLFEKLVAEDYSLTAVRQNGTVYVPADAAERFGSLSGVTATDIDGASYVALDAFCRANGKELLIYGDLAMVMEGASAFDAVTDAAMLDRLIRLFGEHLVADIPCAESRAVVSQTGKTYTYGSLFASVNYCTCPSVAKLNDSVFVSMDTSGGRVFVFESTDNGKTFTFRAALVSFHFATLFELNGALYLMGSYTDAAMDEIGITKSVDGGRSWTPITHFKGPDNLAAHTTSNTVLIANGRVYKAYNGRGGATFKQGCTAYMVSAPVDADLLDPASWTLSNAVAFTTDLFSTHENGSKLTSFAYAEEGNAVVAPDGSIKAIYGVKAVPSYAYAAVFSCSADGTTMRYDAADAGSIIPFPGGNSKFNIRYDEISGKYLALVSRNTDDRNWFQRNVLSLLVSEDLVHWEPVGNLLTDPTVMNDYVGTTRHGFQYVDFITDGDDLLLAVREAMGASDCFHNANYLTFYRVDDFRQYLD